MDEPLTRADAQKLIDKYELPGEPYQLPQSQRMNEAGWGVRYEGVNALEEYDEVMMGHSKYVSLFKGDYVGENLHGDGSVVIPKKVLEVIRVR